MIAVLLIFPLIFSMWFSDAAITMILMALNDLQILQPIQNLFRFGA